MNSLPAMPSPYAPWIKVCGVRSAADMEACARAGATHVGINTWPMSPRSVPPGVVAPLLLIARSWGLAPVLLVLPGDQLPISRIGDFGAAWVQVLAPIPPSLRRKLASGGTLVLEARPAKPGDLGRLRWGDALLLDAHADGRFGGTGRTFPWSRAREAPRPFVLAGGLGPDNVAAAVAACQPSGVDAASGLESAPGVKDPGRIRAFCAAAREALSKAKTSETNIL